MNDILFSVRGLGVSFSSGGKTVRAVDGIDFDLLRGETLALVGESGCGKTTAARTILGVYRPGVGTVTWRGKDVLTLSRRERAAFHKANQMIFQDPYASLDPRMTVGELILEGRKRFFWEPSTQRQILVRELLQTVGLTGEFASRFPHELSGGQRQRVGIARALALEPECLILDEPIAALDVSIQAQIVNLLLRLQQERNLTYLFISHDLTMVRHVSDRIAVMYLGRIVELADTDALYASPQHPYTRALLSAIPKADPHADWLHHRVSLSGEIANAAEGVQGCPFLPRCPRASDRCKGARPELVQTVDGHFTACHLVRADG